MGWLDVFLNLGLSISNTDCSKVIERIRRQFMCSLSDRCRAESTEWKYIPVDLIELIDN
jgi:hypothetical protein